MPLKLLSGSPEKLAPAYSIALLWFFLVLVAVSLMPAPGQAAELQESLLGPGDVVRISVFQAPDMTTETRISEAGTVTFPLVGVIGIGGLSPVAAESKIAAALQTGGFVVQPQVTLFVQQTRSRQTVVLGQVARAGKYPLEEAGARLTDILSLAGGSVGSDTVTVMARRGETYEKFNIDIPEMFLTGDMSSNRVIAGGDIVFVQRAPQFYVVGEVARPGAYRLERKMTVLQAIATAGGITVRGTERGIVANRRDRNDVVQKVQVELNDTVQQDEVIQVKQSIF